MTYGTIFADPPWQYPWKNHFADGGSWSKGRGPTTVEVTGHYETLPTSEICTLPVPRVAADDCFLWLWVTPWHFGQGHHLRVLEAWGFTLRGWRNWLKTGPPGTGSWLRYEHEPLVLATKGDCHRLGPLGIYSTFEAPRGAHSSKPDLPYQDAENVCPGPYLELFAREARPLQTELMLNGAVKREPWTVWGSDVGDPLGWGFTSEEWVRDPNQREMFDAEE